MTLNLDVQKVKQLHKEGKASQLHGRFNTGLLKAAVFGANDGIVTTFAVVAGVAGAGLSPNIVLVMGIANLIADGISMGLGDYLGERSERRHQQYQYQIEQWEIEHIPEEEKQELKSSFSKLTVSEEDSSALVNIISKYPKLWTQLGFIDEMNTVPSTDQGIWKTGLMTFCAFLLAGSLPLLPYFLQATGLNVPGSEQFLYSIVSTGVALFFIGSLRTLITKGAWWWNGLEMLFVGSLAAGSAYIVGDVIQQLIK